MLCQDRILKWIFVCLSKKKMPGKDITLIGLSRCLTGVINNMINFVFWAKHAGSPFQATHHHVKGFWKGDHSKGVSSYYRIIMHHHQLPDNPPPLYQVPLWYVPHPSMRACRGLGLGWSPKGGDCHDIPVNLSELVRLPRHKSQSLRQLTSRSSLGKRHVLLQGFLIHECLRMRSSVNYFLHFFCSPFFVAHLFNKTACSLHPPLCCKLGCLWPEVALKLISENCSLRLSENLKEYL